jgi:hypothetical protein
MLSHSSVRIDRELFEPERPAVPLGLSVYVGDIVTAVDALNVAVAEMRTARDERHLRMMQEAVRDIEKLTRQANTLSDLLDDKISDLRNRDTRVRS